MGAAATPAGMAPSEDFRWSAEFAAFLEAVSRDGHDAVDLVLNGDTFELRRSTAAMRGGRPGAGCREADASARLEHVLKAHAQRDEALAAIRADRLEPGGVRAWRSGCGPALWRRSAAARVRPSARRATGSRFAIRGLLAVAGRPGLRRARPPDRVQRPPVRRMARAVRRKAPAPRGSRVRGAKACRGAGRPPTSSAIPIVDNVAASRHGLQVRRSRSTSVAADRLSPQLLRYDLLLMSWQQFRMELDDGDVVRADVGSRAAPGAGRGLRRRVRSRRRSDEAARRDRRLATASLEAHRS